MDLIRNAKVVTLRSRRGKYLLAKENQESVTQGGEKHSGSRNARWTVELVRNSNSVIRLKNCYNQYLTASDQHFLPGVSMSGFKVLRTRPQMPGNCQALEWEPIREGIHSKRVKLTTHNDTFLRACRLGARPKSVIHERNANNQDEILWEVEIVEITLEAASTFYNLASPEVQKKAVDFFDSMDTDHDGYVSITEFADFFSIFDNSMNRDYFAAFDEDGDERLVFPEVLRLYYMLTRSQAKSFVESLRASVEQPYAQNERVRGRAKTLLAFLASVIQVGAAVYGCTTM